MTQNTNLGSQIADLQKAIHNNTQQLANNDQAIINFIRAQTNVLYRQMESLFSIYSILDFRYPLPPMRGWPISPDFGQLLMAHILKEKPKLIVECGSGISTILSGYTFEKIGGGNIISFDHEAHYAEKTKENLALHQFNENIDVLFAPLCEHKINGQKWQWYNLDQFTPNQKIDVLVVDGPPSTVQKHARYPALPLLREHFSDQITIFIDDAARKEEKEMVNLWLKEFPEFTYETADTEKGTVILRLK